MRGRIPPGATVLDAGCGAGRNLVYFLRAGYRVLGADADPDAVAEVRSLAAALAPGAAGSPEDAFRAEPVEAITFPDGVADVVLSSAVLHFARDPEHFDAMLRGSWRVLRPGGLFFCRLAGRAGMEGLAHPLGRGRYALPDGTERFLADERMLHAATEGLGAELVEPIKTTVVHGRRAMMTWVARRLAPAVAAAALLAPDRGSAQLQPAGGAFWPAAALTIGAAVAGDNWLRRELRGPGAPFVRTTARTVEPLGRARTAELALGGAFVGSALSGHPAWAGATARVAAGFVAADAVTSVLKPFIGRARPYTDRGAYHFRAFAAHDRDHAFPSGHATHAFALAAGVAGEAGRPWVTGVAYGTAALVGWSRVHDDAHWTSDVLAGALVGTSASLTARHWLERRFRRRAADDTASAAEPAAHPRRHAAPAQVAVEPHAVAVRLTF